MAAISLLNPKAEFARASQALAINIAAAKGLQEVMKSNLGPAGTLKMLVSGAGDLKITKDGNVLLHEMQIQNPTAALIARATTAMDDNVGDGTTSTVLFIAELLRQADNYICEGIHPRVITEGLLKAQVKALEILSGMKKSCSATKAALAGVCVTAMKTKLEPKLGAQIADILLDAVECILPKNPENIDLHMIEIMTMQHQTERSSNLIKGLVLDHGTRHPNMPKRVENAYILICNVSLEYEKTEINSGFFYKTAEEREKFVKAERKFIEDRVAKIIQLKKQVCTDDSKNFVVINQKGIDPFSLDVLAKENIMGLRRAKRRNMERLALACGGQAVNSVDDLTPDVLGFSKLVYEHVLGETKYTFVEDCKVCQSVTVLLKGPNAHKLNMMKDAVRDGLRAIKNGIIDRGIIPGGGAFEIKAYNELMRESQKAAGNDIFGIKVFAEALLIIPKVLAANGGHDPLLTLNKIQDTMAKDNNDVPLGFDTLTGEVIDPMTVDLHDNYSVKKQSLVTGSVIATNLLLVDEIMRAGLSSLKG